MIRVLVADDHRLVRQGIRLLLEKAEDIQVVGEAKDGREAVEVASRLAPDIILMDADMPNMDGLSATKMISSLNIGTRVIILSMFSDDYLVRKGEESGAKAYIMKKSDRDELLAAIRAVYEKGTGPKIEG
jgi:two-component system response regulator NreC